MRNNSFCLLPMHVVVTDLKKIRKSSATLICRFLKHHYEFTKERKVSPFLAELSCLMLLFVLLLLFFFLLPPSPSLCTPEIKTSDEKEWRPTLMKATGRFGSFSSRTSWNSSSVLSRIWSRPTRTGRPPPPCCQSLCSDSIEERRPTRTGWPPPPCCQSLCSDPIEKRRPWRKRRWRNIWSWRQRAGSSRGNFELRAEGTKGWRSVSFEPEKFFIVIIKSCNDFKFEFSILLIPCYEENCEKESPACLQVFYPPVHDFLSK